MDSLVVFVNFKVYKESFGKSALRLAKACESVSNKTGVVVIPVVSALDLRVIAKAVSIPVFSQHVDPISFGRGNGKIPSETLHEADAAGAVVNHAEDKVMDSVVEDCVLKCHSAKLRVLACAETELRAKSIASFSPDFLAVEPPELIGGNVSVSTADPELVSRSVALIREVNHKVVPIMGAGVKSFEDAKRCVELGARGVFVSSGVVLAENPKAALLDLAKGLKAGAQNQK